MIEYSDLAILAGFVFLYSVVAARLEKTVVSGAVLFTGVGLAFGPLGLGILHFELDTELLRTLAELTLALVLFTDAANADLGVLRKTYRVPERLLLIGLPLTIGLGFVAGWLTLSGVTLLEIAILATMLAPTDAALGKPVVTNPDVPPRIRESLNVESGLNDGICVPVLFIFLALAAQRAGEGGTTSLAFRLVAEEIGIGALTGVAIASLGAFILHRSVARRWIAESWAPLPIVALAVACFGTAQALGGSGFIASFVAGLTFGALAKPHHEKLLTAAEGTGSTLTLLTWVFFGAAVISQAVEHFRWPILLYALLSLTVVRMLPVFLCLMGSGLDTKSRLFIGWFGPRGLASVVFIVIVLGENLPGQEILAMTVVCTVVLSIVAHGVTANPLAKAYGSRAREPQ